MVAVWMPRALGAQDATPVAEQSTESLAAYVDAIGVLSPEPPSAEDCQRAIPALHELSARAPHVAPVWLGLAVCLETLGDLRAAWDALEEVPLEGALPDAVRAVDEAKGRLLRSLGTVRSAADNLTLRADDSHSCLTPCSLLLTPGLRNVEIERDGERQTYDVEIRAGETSHVVWVSPPAEVETEGEVEPDPPDGRRYRPGALTLVGGILAAGGGAGILGFGVRTLQTRSDFDGAVTAPMPDDSMIDSLGARGDRLRRATNISIAVAAVGLAMMALEIVLDLARD